MKPSRFVSLLGIVGVAVVEASCHAQIAPPMAPNPQSIAVGKTAQAAPRIELPIHQTVLKDGDIRYFVPVVIDGVGPIEAMLDTGSKGLRVLVASLGHAYSGKPANYAYGSGVRLKGTIVPLVIRLGEVHGMAAIQVITSVDCLEKMPHCPASRMEQRDYRIGGDGMPDQGFQAIMGIGVTVNGRLADNPLAALGINTWIVKLPRPGESRPGELILNPSIDEQRVYAHFPVNGHGQIDGCLQNRSSRRQFCEPILLDSGSGTVVVFSPDVSHPESWPTGTPGLLRFGPEQADTASSMQFEAQIPSSPAHVRLMPQDAVRPPHILAGTLPYFSFAVLYNNDAPWIGLAKRTD